ncbi:MAG: type II secretion system protein GspM [Pseudomonadota bacterium]
MRGLHFTPSHAPTLALSVVMGAVGLVALVSLGLLAGSLSGLKDGIADKRSFLERAQAAARLRPDAAQLENIFYVADTPQDALAQLQTDMTKLTGDAGMQIEVMQADQIGMEDALVRLTLSLNGVVPETGLGTLLNAIATAEPTVFVETMSLRRARRTSRGPGPRFISVRLELHAYQER